MSVRPRPRSRPSAATRAPEPNPTPDAPTVRTVDGREISRERYARAITAPRSVEAVAQQLYVLDGSEDGYYHVDVREGRCQIPRPEGRGFHRAATTPRRCIAVSARPSPPTGRVARSRLVADGRCVPTRPMDHGTGLTSGGVRCRASSAPACLTRFNCRWFPTAASAAVAPASGPSDGRPVPDDTSGRRRCRREALYRQKPVDPGAKPGPGKRTAIPPAPKGAGFLACSIRECPDAEYRGHGVACRHAIQAALVEVVYRGVTSPFVARVCRAAREYGCPTEGHQCNGPTALTDHGSIPCPPCTAVSRHRASGTEHEMAVWRRLTGTER